MSSIPPRHIYVANRNFPPDGKGVVWDTSLLIKNLLDVTDYGNYALQFKPCYTLEEAYTWMYVPGKTPWHLYGGSLEEPSDEDKIFFSRKLENLDKTNKHFYSVVMYGGNRLVHKSVYFDCTIYDFAKEITLLMPIMIANGGECFRVNRFTTEGKRRFWTEHMESLIQKVGSYKASLAGIDFYTIFNFNQRMDIECDWLPQTRRITEIEAVYWASTPTPMCIVTAPRLIFLNEIDPEEKKFIEDLGIVPKEYPFIII